MKAVMAAFRAYLNYDGEGHGFGDTYLKTDVSDPVITNRPTQNERMTAYASIDQSDPRRMVIIAINKSQTTAITTGFQVVHTVRFDKAEVYQITGGVGSCTGPTRMAEIPIAVRNAFTATLPPLSISTIVLKASQERLFPSVNLRIEP
jgi:O-glycosyl hydrolase